MKYIKFLILILMFFINFSDVQSAEERMDFQFELSQFLKIETVSSPVLVANITDSTGNLYAPLSSRFKVITNSSVKQTLYLKAESLTENGKELSMFESGGRVYIAFTNVNKLPSSQALSNCKMGTHSKYSPGVVAYPITSIIGAEHQYQKGKNNYKVYVDNGVTDILVNIGSNVLSNSFDTNDPFGFYQATLSLTESEI